MPCVFIRTTGCNLRCVWCDTEYAFWGGEKLTVDQIISKVESYNCKLVEITGGEPLLQKEVPQLASRLLEKDYTVLVETSGERDISVLDKRVIKIMDLKCPGSGESHRNCWENLEYLRSQDEVKFVINDREDYEWSVKVVRKYDLEKRASVLFSPVWGELELNDLAKWILQDKINVRYQVQLHKIIWSPEAKGV